MSEKLTPEQIVDIVKKLVGQTSWWGDSWKDDESFENLKVYGEVIYQLVCDLADKHISSLNKQEGCVQTLNKQYDRYLSYINDIMLDSIAEINQNKENKNEKH